MQTLSLTTQSTPLWIGLAFCVEHHGIDKDVVSDTKFYTAEKFARHNEDADMLEFLQLLDV